MRVWVCEIETVQDIACPDRLWGPPSLLSNAYRRLGVKRPGREADHSSPSSVDVKNAWRYASTPQYAFMAWCCVKAQGQLYIYLRDRFHRLPKDRLEGDEPEGVLGSGAFFDLGTRWRVNKGTHIRKCESGPCILFVLGRAILRQTTKVCLFYLGQTRVMRLDRLSDPMYQNASLLHSRQLRDQGFRSRERLSSSDRDFRWE
jgi:hypothetical protein